MLGLVELVVFLSVGSTADVLVLWRKPSRVSGICKRRVLLCLFSLGVQWKSSRAAGACERVVLLCSSSLEVWQGASFKAAAAVGVLWSW